MPTIGASDPQLVAAPVLRRCCQLSEKVRPKAPSLREHHRHSLRSLPSEARLREYTGSAQPIDSLRPFGAPPSVREALGWCVIGEVVLAGGFTPPVCSSIRQGDWLVISDDSGKFPNFS